MINQSIDLIYRFFAPNKHNGARYMKKVFHSGKSEKKEK